MTADGEDLTTRQAATLAGVTPRAIRGWVDAGHLPAHKGQRGQLHIGRADFLRVAATLGYAIREATPAAGAGEEDAPAALAELARTIDRMTREHTEMAGRVGFLQGRVLQLEAELDRTTKLLTAPKVVPVSVDLPRQEVPTDAPVATAGREDGADQAATPPPGLWDRLKARWGLGG